MNLENVLVACLLIAGIRFVEATANQRDLRDLNQWDAEYFEVFQPGFDLEFVQGQGLNVSAHRTMVAGHIPYFRRRLQNDNSSFTRIDLGLNINFPAFKCLLQFAYTQRLRISKKNVLELIKSAQLLGMSDVVAASTKYINTRFTPQWAVGILNMDDSDDLAFTKLKALEYCRHNILKVTASDAIVNLNTEDFIKLLRSDCLSLSTEVPMYNVAIRWLRHDAKRTNLDWQILRHVRFGLLSLAFLTSTVHNERIVQNSNKLKAQLNHAVGNIVGPQHQKKYERCQEWPRTGTEKFIFFSRKDRYVQILDLKTRQARNLTRLVDRSEYAVTFYECNFYIFGGGDKPKFTTNVTRYHAKSDTWSQLALMKGINSDQGAAIFNDKIVVTGGFSDSALSSAEFYNPSTNTWLHMVSMLEPRYLHKLIVFQDKMYALGGSGAYIMNTVEIYDLPRNRWIWGKPMLVARDSLAAVVFNDKIYVCGGRVKGYTTTNTCEVFDPVNQEWKPIAPMNRPRQLFSLLVHKDKLLAIGGNLIDDIDIYDPEADTWNLERFKFDTHLENGYTFPVCM